jgi:hypothetical protein
MFFNVIDISRLAGQPMIVEYIYGHTKNAIEIVQLQNVVQVIVGNAFNCKAMDNLVTKDTPQLFGHLVLPIVLIKYN